MGIRNNAAESKTAMYLFIWIPLIVWDFLSSGSNAVKNKAKMRYSPDQNQAQDNG